MAREVVTLQLGSYANHVGAHWWNLQEAGFIYDPLLLPLKEVENDILFRLGRTVTGEETYTPRLLLFDARSSFRPLPELGVPLVGRGEGGREVSTWSGQVEEIGNEVKGIDGGVGGQKEGQEFNSSGACCMLPNSPLAESNEAEQERWSDFLVTYLHSRSVCCIPREVELGFPQANSYNLGAACLQDNDFSSRLENQLHFFVEDCDNLQGFQLLSNLDDGFGSLSSSLLHSLSDDFLKSGKFCLPFSPPIPSPCPHDTFPSAITSALNLSDWMEHASMVTPLSTLPPSPPAPFLSSHPTPYHTSAVLAAGVDTCSLIYRVPDAGVDIQDFCAIMTPAGRKLTSLSSRFPFPLLSNSTLMHSLSLHPLSSAPYLTPCLDPSSSSLAACNVIRGVPASYKLFDSRSAQHTSYDSFTSLNDLISHEYGNKYTDCTSFSFVANSPLTLRHPFPQIFTPDVTPHGLIRPLHKQELENGGASPNMVKSIPVGTSVENNNGIYSLLNACVNLFQQKTYLHLFSARQSVERDSIEENKHSLLDLMDRYPAPVEMQSPSDSDSD